MTDIHIVHHSDWSSGVEGAFTDKAQAALFIVESGRHQIITTLEIDALVKRPEQEEFNGVACAECGIVLSNAASTYLWTGHIGDREVLCSRCYKTRAANVVDESQRLAAADIAGAALMHATDRVVAGLGALSEPGQSCADCGKPFGFSDPRYAAADKTTDPSAFIAKVVCFKCFEVRDRNEGKKPYMLVCHDCGNPIIGRQYTIQPPVGAPRYVCGQCAGAA